MYFQFPDNPEFNNLRTYTTWASLFDPNVNKTFLPVVNGERHFRVSDQLALLKAVYTKDNIAKNLASFAPEVCQYHPTYRENDGQGFRDLVNCIPDDLMWMFHFLRYQSGRPGQRSWTFFVFNQQRSNNCSALQLKGIGTSDTLKTFRNDEEFRDAIEAASIPYLQYFNEHADKKYNCGDSWVHHNITLLLQQFVNGTLNYNHQGRTHRHLRAFWSSIQDSNFTVSTDYSDTDIDNGYYFSLISSVKVSKNYRDPLYEILNYSTNPCGLIDWPLVEPNEHKPVLYGIELESSFDYDIKQIIDAQHQPFFIAKQDGSITGTKRHKAELVTIPMSMKAHKRHWAHWFKQIDYSRFDTSKDTNNGMHVHIDRKAFDDKKHIRNMTWFYTNPANRDFLVYVSERGSYNAMASYTPICTFPSHLSKVRAYKECERHQSGLRGIMNFGKPATIEIRMFRGIASFAELVKNLEFVDAVLSFTRGEHNMNTLSAERFMSWLSKTHPNRYSVLKEYFARCKNMDVLMASCEIWNVVFNKTDPETVLQLINKSNIQLNNMHISALNKGRKRTYVLDKETQKLKLVQSNRSRLAEMDRTIESRYTRNAFAA